MIKDITIGQYFPGTSPIHKLDPRMKIVLTFIYIIFIFLCRNFVAMGAMALLLLATVLKIGRAHV